MNGYSSLTSSPPMAGGAALPSAKEDGAWEGVAVGAATLVRNFSSASQRVRAGERSMSGHRGHGLRAAVWRAFSMRSHPSSLAEGYWRIHDDMDVDCDDDAEDLGLSQDEEQRKQHQVGEATLKKKKKRRVNILRACKKLVGF